MEEYKVSQMNMNKLNKTHDQNNHDDDNKNNGVFKSNQLVETTSFAFKLILFLVGFLGLQAVAFIVSIMLQKVNDYSYWVNLVTYIIIFAIFAVLIFTNKNKAGLTFLKEFKDYKVYLYGLASFAIMFLINFIFNLAYSKIPGYGENLNQNGVESFVSNNVLKNFLLFFEIVIFAPFIEEFTYRLGLCGICSGKKRNYIIGIIVSSLVFGLIHFNAFTLYVSKVSIDAAIKIENAEAISSLCSSLGITISGNPLDSQNIDLITSKLNTLIMNEWLNLPIYIISGVILNLSYLLSGKLASSFTTHFTNNLFSYITMFIPSQSVVANCLILI